MAKAKKLPSGNWRVLVYSGTHPITKKRSYESFTAGTKKEAEYLAAEYARDKSDKKDVKNITVKEGIDRYIDSKEAIISASTLREYRKAAERDLTDLHNVKYKDLTQEKIQTAINTESKTHSPKTVKNMHGLLSASLNMFYPDFRLKTTLPQKIKTERYVPTDEDVRKLLKQVEGKKVELPILLAATGSLRRSEIAPLTSDDVTDFGVIINKAMVKSNDGKWVIKQPKTSAGYRTVPLPQELIKKLKSRGTGDIIDMKPDKIYRSFKQALQSCGVKDFRFHDLRHYYASTLHALNVPDKYIMQYGGWNTDTVLKTVYQHVKSDKEKSVQKQVVNFFDSLSAGDKKAKTK